MEKRKFWNIFIILAVYIVTISFPIYLLTNDIYVRAGVMLGLRTAYLIFIILFSIFSKLAKSYNGKPNYKNMFLLMPLFIVAFMNIFYWGVVVHSSFDTIFQKLSTEGNRSLEIMMLLNIINT